jgi:hypothetical protein
MNLKNFNIGLNGKPVQFKQVSLNGCLFKNIQNNVFVDKGGQKKK